jgi:hypothetical protein
MSSSVVLWSYYAMCWCCHLDLAVREGPYDKYWHYVVVM